MALFSADLFAGKLFAGKLFSVDLNPVLENVSSGVRRLWLAELTARLNGMLGPEQENQHPITETAPVPERVTEQADGSAVIGELAPKPVRRERRPKQVKTTKLVERKVRQQVLPDPQQTASYIFAQFNNYSLAAANDTMYDLAVLRGQIEQWQEDEALSLILLAA